MAQVQLHPAGLLKHRPNPGPEGNRSNFPFPFLRQTYLAQPKPILRQPCSSTSVSAPCRVPNSLSRVEAAWPRCTRLRLQAVGAESPAEPNKEEPTYLGQTKLTWMKVIPLGRCYIPLPRVQNCSCLISNPSRESCCALSRCRLDVLLHPVQLYVLAEYKGRYTTPSARHMHHQGLFLNRGS